MVGLAFEVNTAYTNSKSESNEAINKREQEMFANLSFIDCMHYSFNYIGVLTGMCYLKLNNK